MIDGDLSVKQDELTNLHVHGLASE